MLPIIPKLLQIQDRDQRLRQLRKDLANLPKQRAMAESQLHGDRTAVEKAEAGVREIEVAIKAVELDVGTRRNTIQRLEQQQFETRKNDEFRALGTEITRYKKEISDLEDKELEQMVKLDEAKARLDEARGKLGGTQTRVDEELKMLEVRAENEAARVQELEAERATLAEPLQGPDLTLYDRIFQKKGDAAVVPLSGDKCAGCHMKVVTGTVQALKQMETLTQCDSCGRILYLAE
ncbi:MAG: hypothetical protein KDK99_15245 [Verrucomicrobiales bacterium]|nr:hypothetical protein [Verrucomicrobiales bacterium]